MIRPDRPIDKQSNRYSTDDERRQGDMAMKAWFEYFAAKGWHRRFNSWRSIFKSGHSLMVPCDRPETFDVIYIPGAYLPPNFWDQWELERARNRRSLTDQELARRKRICENTVGKVVNASKVKEKLKSTVYGDSRTPSEAIPWEERAKLYSQNPSRLSTDALKTHAVTRSWPEENEL